VTTERQLPILVSGQREYDMGVLADILPEFGQKPVFEERVAVGVEFTPAAFAGLVILGDDSDHRATSKVFDKERRWLGIALAAGRPVLGICLGAQLLAAHLTGGRRPCGLSGLDRTHNGVVEVQIAEVGGPDPVMAPLGEHGLVTVSHSDCFLKPPPGTAALAWSTCDGVPPHCEAFRVGPPDHAVYGLQFHPEPSWKMLRDDGWFYAPRPSEADMKKAAGAGERVLRAWAELAAVR
jgi:GMP synthase (glutamine-hydrolysing)